MRDRKLWLILAIAWMAVIFWFSSQSSLPSAIDDLLDAFLKKTGHFSAYAILWTLWYLATGRRGLALVIAVLYAISDEWHQTMVPGRNGWWLDVLIDSSGALAALWFSTTDLARELGGRLGLRRPLDQNIAK